LVKQCILQISCNGRLSQELLTQVINPSIHERLLEMEHEGILYLHHEGLEVTTAGKPFIRNICKVFDKRINEQENSSLLFSKSI
jgi:oxygen-independent coproporphyrinogen-3 oxidase